MPEDLWTRSYRCEAYPNPGLRPTCLRRQARRSFSDAEREYCEALPRAADPASFARSEFDRLEKSKLRAVMYKEQGFVCAYCERQIQRSAFVPRIDHRRPLSLNPDVALHWKNLYLSCASIDTCDAAKRDRPLRWDDSHPDLPWPTDLDFARHTSHLRVAAKCMCAAILDWTVAPGEFSSSLSTIRPDGTRMRKAILNLNHPSLVAARAAAIDSERTRIERDFKGVVASKRERDRRAFDRLREAQLQSFVSSRVCWLRKLVGRGR